MDPWAQLEEHMVTSFFFFLLAQIEKWIARKGTKTQSPRENQRKTEGKSRNNTHMRPNLPHNHWVVSCHNKIFDPPSRIDLVKNILVGHVRVLFQIRDSPFPLNPPIIMQGVPNDLTCFLYGPLPIIPLAPSNPRKTTSQEHMGTSLESMITNRTPNANTKGCYIK